MTQVPHCPDCGRADTVDPHQTRSGDYAWVCNKPACGRDVITQSDVRDIPFMAGSQLYDESDIKSVSEQDYSNECTCNWCVVVNR